MTSAQGNTASRLAEAKTLIKAGRTHDAEAVCLSVLSDSPGEGEFLHLLGMLRLGQGKLGEAEGLFRRALEARPDVASPCHNLAILLSKTGRAEEAIPLFKQALAIQPNYVDAKYNLASAQRALGRVEEAEQSLNELLADQPDHFNANYLQALTLQSRGKLDAAAKVVEHCLALRPDDQTTLITKAGLEVQRGQPEAAERFLRPLLERHPESPELQNAYGGVLRGLGRLDEATTAFEAALSSNPNLAEARNNLASIYRDRGQLEKAVAEYERAIAANPKAAAFHNNIALAHSERGHGEQAIDCFKRALTLQPDYPEALNNLASTYRALGRLDEALVSCRQALKLRPEFANAWNNLGGALLDQGRLEECIEAYRRALSIRPDRAMIHSNLLLALHYDPRFGAEEILAESRRWADGKDVAPAVGVGEAEEAPDPERKLRIGYVSPDLRNHAVCSFLRPVFDRHHRSRVQVYCYGEIYRPDETTQWLKVRSDRWCDTPGMTTEQLAERIRDDKIDILVDLAGHTAKNRLPVFAARAAPIQATWLGYAGTTGLSAMDYRISDAVADPPGETDQFNSETLLRLPGFLCYGPPADAPEVAERPRPDSGSVTFGSFNNISKVTPQVVARWSEILHRLPSARMLIKARALSDASTRRRYCELFAEHGIEESRVDLVSWIDSTEGHLGAYGKVDIALDTFPYNGTTTTCEALWMGVPVVTFTGRHHASRVGASLLSRVGLEDLVGEDEDSYVDLAVSLAQDPDRLVGLHNNLRERMAISPLCDGAAFTKALEDGYREIWRNWCQAREQ